MNDLFVISAASGVGKTSLVDALLKSVPGLTVSVSHTTRAPRPGEVDGVNYHFVAPSHFATLLEQQAFIEHARVFGNLYGVSREEVTRRLSSGNDVVLVIDWQGAQRVRTIFPNAVTVFILPPSREALRERLQGRGQDHAEIIESRLTEACREMSHWNEFDYTVVNDDFATALADLTAIVRARRLLRTHCAVRLAPLINTLLA
ncbi:guanylate kinase [Gammaproteobacteria bacterium]